MFEMGDAEAGSADIVDGVGSAVEGRMVPRTGPAGFESSGIMLSSIFFFRADRVGQSRFSVL